MTLARAHAQGLIGPGAPDAAGVVRSLVGVQAQDVSAGMWSIGVRCGAVSRADVERALYQERSLVRVWAMRGTLHFVPSEDAAWLVELLGPVIRPQVERRLSQLGVPPADWPRALDALCGALAEHGALTRPELMSHVAAAGVETGGQAGAHLPGLAALDGLVCFGEPRGGKPTYVLRDDWLRGAELRRQSSREEAVRELCERYLEAFGPASVEDFGAWSGLGLRDARAAWPGADREAEAVVEPDPPDVRLLPAFDTYLLGYRSRAFCVPEDHARRVWPGGGIVRPAVISNGHAVGTWRRRGQKVDVDPFPGTRILEEPLAEAVAAFARFGG